MKTIARRAFLRMLPAAGFAGKAAAEQAAAQLAGIETVGLGGLRGGVFEPLGVGGADQPTSTANFPSVPRSTVVQGMLRVPGLRDELTSLLFEQNRQVNYLDHDLASKRSYSLAAKITFQRQRNVERHIHQDLAASDHPYDRFSALIKRARDRLFGGGP